jgi:hypothetical protein
VTLVLTPKAAKTCAIKLVLKKRGIHHGCLSSSPWKPVSLPRRPASCATPAPWT